ncbi:hypothetical protein J4E82_006890 [Alternaria postmessia]|uniref:uncharacterized protein n=1 Tax=Alternaria postmessia TaxID=1187938 RepID=UPI00222489D3|nr:uncharacterized protein J4E82_006890 [Alternaria postmessia]KAI5374475.1 hypothetical protein J4E82_006890 [Alternaria postmessia]
MTDFNETRSPLTNDNVQAWARANFAAPFRALPRAARLHWIQFDESFTISRAIWRGLGRSTHKQLLVIGGYAPGPAGDDDEPIDRVTAHVHEDEAEVSFYRITELDDGSSELQAVNSTSTVAFHAPFCDDSIVVRPKRSSTVSSLSRSITEDIQAPPIKRAATDSLNVKIKRERDEDYTGIASAIRPKKHPRRTLSEQIIVPSSLKQSTTAPSPSSILSPRSPAPERVNRALTDRIQNLKDENAGLKDVNAGLKASVNGLETEKIDLQKRMEKESHAYRGLEMEFESIKKEMMAMKERLESVETSGEKVRVEVDRLKTVEEASKELRKELRNEVEKLRGRVERSEKEAENAKEELLAVRRGLTKELGEAVKKWGA